jgi:hypothetical protein
MLTSETEVIEQRRAKARAYYAANRGVVKAQHARYYAANSAKVIARQQGYQRWRYANDPAWRSWCLERQRAIRALKRAAKASAVAVAA